MSYNLSIDKYKKGHKVVGVFPYLAVLFESKILYQDTLRKLIMYMESDIEYNKFFESN